MERKTMLRNINVNRAPNPFHKQKKRAKRKTSSHLLYGTTRSDIQKKLPCELLSSLLEKFLPSPRQLASCACVSTFWSKCTSDAVLTFVKPLEAEGPGGNTSKTWGEIHIEVGPQLLFENEPRLIPFSMPLTISHTHSS